MIMAMLMAFEGGDAQTVVGAAGAILTAGGGVAWVIRVEKDLMASYRSRMVELQGEILKANKERDTWRERFWVLTRLAMGDDPVPWARIDALLSEDPRPGTASPPEPKK